MTLSFLPTIDLLVTRFKDMGIFFSFRAGMKFLKDNRYHHNSCLSTGQVLEFDAKPIFGLEFYILRH